MRPSFQIAPGTPCSATTYRSSAAWSMLPWRSSWVRERNESCGVGGTASGRDDGGTVIGATGTAASGVAPPSALLPGARLVAGPGSGTATGVPSGVRVPSKLTAGDKPKARPSRLMPRITSDVRIQHLLDRASRMGHRPHARRPDLLAVLHQLPGCELGLARSPRFGACLDLGIRQLDLEGALHRIDGDDVAVAHMRDRAADGGFRPDMTDAETTRGAGEAPVGNER